MAKFKFGQKDIFHARAKVHPKNQFWVLGSHIYLNGDQRFSASFYPGGPDDGGGIVKHLGNADNTSSGSISLYEMNIDRAFDNKIYAWLPKGSNLETFKTITTASVDASTADVFAATEYGETIEKFYPLSGSISINYFSASSGFTTIDPNAITANYSSSTGREISALRNTLNFYTKWSPHYAYSSSIPPGCEKAKQAMCMVAVPSIFYGSSIEKGSVNLKFYITGTLVGEIKDEKRNGELVQVGPVGSNGSASVAGVVLYNEGFLILTGNWDLDALAIGPFLGYANGASSAPADWLKPRWQYFGLLGATGTLNQTASYYMSFEGRNYIPNITMHARAPKGQVNYSNNPTFLSYNQTSGTFTTASSTTTSSVSFIQSPTIETVPINSSSFSSYSSSRESVTYLSKIGIYDEYENLIAVAKMATPVRKREQDDLTFRLKLDI